MNNAPIGVLDSGLGGLSVWRVMRRMLPRESLLYFGDGKHCPYGPKPKEDVIGYVDEIVRFLLDRSVKLIVLACNAATAAAIETLRERYDLPFVGMEPAVKPAALTTKSGVIGILATEQTFQGELYRRTAAQYAEQVKIIEAVGEGFVELVETHRERSAEAVDAVKRVIEPMVAAGADRIVLGCTHYPFLAEAIRQVAGEDVTLIDPAPAVVRRVSILLTEHGATAAEDHKPDDDFFTNADARYRTGIVAKSVQALKLEL